MSTNPKTHTLAPEQQAKLNHLVEREMDEAYYTGLYMKAKDARACLREFAVEVLEELGVPVEAREEASDNEGVDLEHCACCGQQFDANHLDHDTLTCQNCISAAVDLYYSQGEAAELRALVGRLVKEVGYRTLDWAGTVCSYCGADQPGSEHWEDCIVLVAERRLAGGESER